MESRVRLLGHPLHQMLVPIPFGLLATAVIFDVVALLTRNGYWHEIAFWMIVAGIIGGLVAAPVGLADWLKIPSGTRARRVGAWHGIGNLVMLLLYACSLWFRLAEPTSPTVIALAFSFVAVALAGLTGWLGGELVDRHGVGVADGAHVDSPSSLSGRPASGRAGAHGV